MRTTPTAALEILLDLRPLWLHVQGEAMASCYRMAAQGTWGREDIDYGHSQLLKVMRGIVPISAFPSDLMLPQHRFNKGFQVVIPSREDWVDQGKSLLGDSEVIYTDGSLMEGRAGAGVHYSQDQELIISLGEWATVYQSEVVAIEAATGLQSIGECNNGIKICSDSQASLKALAAPVVKSKLIYECQVALKALAEHNKVELIWVPGHRGIDGNEAADRLAKEGSSRAMIGPEPALGISPKIVRREIHKYLQRAHKEYWEGLNTCKQAKELMGGLNKKRAKQIIRLPRNKLQLIGGVLTGHCGLDKHLTVINIRNDPLCQLCWEEEETAFHFLGECPAFSALRIRILGVDTLTAREIRNLPISVLWRIIKESGRLKR